MDYNTYAKIKLDKAYEDDYPKSSKWARSKLKRMTRKEVNDFITDPYEVEYYLVKVGDNMYLKDYDYGRAVFSIGYNGLVPKDVHKFKLQYQAFEQARELNGEVIVKRYREL